MGGADNSENSIQLIKQKKKKTLKAKEMNFLKSDICVQWNTDQQ